HHDLMTGRAVARRAGGPQRVDRLKIADWAQLRLRDVESGNLTNERPPTFVEAVQVFRAHAKPGQVLNIDVKHSLTFDDAYRINAHLASRLSSEQYVFSSGELQSLERLRAA